MHQSRGHEVKDQVERPPPHVGRRWLFDEPVWLAVASSSSLASRDRVTLPELDGHSWIARPNGPLRRLLDRACQEAGFTPLIAHESENNRVIRSLIAADLGVALAAPGIPAAPDITVVPLQGVADLQYHLLWNTHGLTATQAEHISVAMRNWYRADALRSPLYWSWMLAHR